MLRTRTHLATTGLLLVLLSCDESTGGPAGPGGFDAGPSPADAAARVDGADVEGSDAASVPVQELSGPEISTALCGAYRVTADLTVPAGATVTLCPGTTLTFAARTGLLVVGTLTAHGSASARITLTSDATWQGLSVRGALDASFVDITHAQVAIDGRPRSTVRFDDGTITQSAFTLQLASGGTFARDRFVGGGSVSLTDGMLVMTDVLLDLQHPTLVPDCTAISGGGLTLDHVRFTGCHCPIHIERTTVPSTVTASILDEATNAVMIANSETTFRGNHLLARGTKMLDIGTGSGVTADVGGNYWGGGAPDIGTHAPAQFRNIGDYLGSPPAAGPR